MRRGRVCRLGSTVAVLATLASMWIGCGAVGAFLAHDLGRDVLLGGAIAAALAAMGQQDATIDDLTGDLEQMAGLPAPGVPGEQGEAGPEGSPGEQGEPGPTGPTGPQGEAGEAGADGEQGPTGPAGPTGPTGAQGPEGATGATGPQGAEGATGATGPQGLEGPTGATGPAGAAGPEFFDIFVDEFYGADGFSFRAYPTFIRARGWKVAIPYRYQAGNQVTMRMFLYGRFLPEQLPVPECQVLRLVALRLRHGGTLEHYGPLEQYLTLEVPPIEDAEYVQEDGCVWAKVFMVVDLPLNVADGLALPDDLLPGDLLGFGGEWASPGCPDNGVNFRLYGVEFIESAVGEIPLSGAVITPEVPDCTCDSPTNIPSES